MSCRSKSSSNFLAAAAVFSLLLHYGSSQLCYSRPDCQGVSFPVTSARECCVGTEEGLSFSDGSSADCTISQCIVHGFLHASYDVTEGETLETTFRLNVKGITRFPLLTLPGTISVVEDTATSSDYETFAPTTTSESGPTPITFVPVDDATTLEYDDRVTLTYTPNIPTLLETIQLAEEFIRHTATVDIADSDRLEINFEDSKYSVHEDGTPTPPIRVHFRRVQRPFSLVLSPVSIDTAKNMSTLRDFIDLDDTFKATPGSDFTGEPVTVTIAPTAGISFRLPPVFQTINDNLNENKESFVLVAEIIPETPGDVVCFQRYVGDTDCHGRVGATLVDIIDDDSTTFVGFSQRRQTVSEGDTPFGADGFYVTTRIHSGGSERRSYPIRVRVTPNNSTVEGTNIQFESSYDALYGTRDSSDDPVQEIIDLPAGSFELHLRLFIRDDLLAEGLECFTLKIRGIDVPGSREISACHEDDDDDPTEYFCKHTICIEDNDDPSVVGFVRTACTVAESKGQVEVCVNLTKSHGPTEIQLDVFRDDTATPPGSVLATPDSPTFLGTYPMHPLTDYEEQTPFQNRLSSSTITETARTACFSQTVYRDLRVEPMEYLGLAVAISASTVKTIVDPSFSKVAIKIVDENIAGVCLEETIYYDVGGAIEVCAVVTTPNIECPIGFPFSVTLSTSDGTNPTLPFAECEERSCINVASGAFPVHLEETPDLDSRIQLCPEEGRVPDVVVEFERTAQTVNEDAGSVEVCAIIRGDTAGDDIYITLLTEDDTAQAGRDYTHKKTESVFSGRQCVTIPIIDDYLPGSPVQFSVKATSSSHRIPPATSTVVILDDEITRGCTYEIVNASLAEEKTREEVVVEIADALSSVLTTPLGGIVGGKVPAPNDTSDEPPLKIVYTAIAEEFEVDTSDEGFSNFTAAITEITEAKEAACEGGGVTEEDIPRLGREYRELREDIEANVDKAREIFGKMLCLSERSREERRKKRQAPICPDFGAPCFCPDTGLLICVCEFFACLDPDDDIMPILGIIDVDVPEGFPCLAFAVDTTGSMGGEIAAAKEVIRSFLSSEEDGPGCYVLQPFNDLRNGVFEPGSIPAATIATTYSDTSVTELESLLSATEALRASGGGDGPERQFRALLAILSLRDSFDLDVMIPGSEIVLLTDAISHDAELVDAVIARARELKVCISFYLSVVTWEPYTRISEQTGGTIVGSIHRSAFLEFDAEHDYGQCAIFYGLPTFNGRKKRAVVMSSSDTEQRCHSFNISSLAMTLTVQGFTTQDAMIVTKPNSEVQRVINNIMGDKVYRDSAPIVGQYSVCVEIGTLTISLDTEDSLGSVLQFLTSIGDSLSFRNSPLPPACTEGVITVETAQIDDIRSTSLQLVDTGSGEVLSTAPLHRCANQLLGNVSFPQATVSYRAVGTDSSGRPFDASLSKTATFTQLEGAKFRVEMEGESHIEVEQGQTMTITVTVHNHHTSEGHYSFTAEPVEGFRQAFRPTSLVVAPGETGSVNLVILQLSTVAGTTHTFTTTVTDGCVIHSVSKAVTLVEPATTPPPAVDECGCENGGTCVIRVIRGRRILRCACPDGFSGSRCENTA